MQQEQLKKFAQYISKNVRKSDTVCRFGGEEFIILAPKTTLEEGFVIAENLRKVIFKKAFVMGTVKIHLSVSFGVSLLLSTETGNGVANGNGAVNVQNDIDNCLSKADNALYLAKESGKNRAVKASYNS